MKLLTKEKLQYWGHSLLHPFDGFFEIRFRNQGSLLIATLLLVAYAILRCLSYQYTGFPMNMNNIDEMDALSIFISTISVVVLGAVANWTITTLFNGKGKMKDIFIVVCYSLTVLIIGDAGYEDFYELDRQYDKGRLAAFIEKLKGRTETWLVAGHEPPLRREAFIEYLESVYREL